VLAELLPYFERELDSLTGLALAFAQRYPKIASRLQVEEGEGEDPHVERLVEAFALLAARIHRRMDDDYPEIIEAFIQILYPQYLQPIPSATVVQLVPLEGRPASSGRCTLPRRHPVYSPEVQGVRCHFRTCFDVDLWPVTVAEARLELAQESAARRRLSPGDAVLTLELEARDGLDFAALKIDRLRFFLDGNPPQMHLLYQLLFSGLCGIRASDGRDEPAHAVQLDLSALRPVGFEPEESMLDADPRSFSGFRLLSEYFAFPDKFMFFDLGGLDHPDLLHSGNRLQLQFLISHYGTTERYVRLLQTLSAANFKLGCVPAVNLFKRAAEPIRVTHQQVSYPVLPQGRRPDAYEVYAIDSVTKVDVPGDFQTLVPPFYSVCHFSSAAEQSYYWYATRERSTRQQDLGSEVEVTLLDLDFQPQRPASEVLSLELTCTNRDLPASLPFGGAANAFEAFLVPNHPGVKEALPLRKPTPSLRPPAKHGLQRRLVSHLCLNQMSLATQGREALQEMLGLYDFTHSPAVRRQILGIHTIRTRPVTARLPGREFSTLARGIEVAITFDEDYYVGSNLYLFASLLERFLGHLCAPNSFIKMRMFTRQQEGEVSQWPCRAGATTLI